METRETAELNKKIRKYEGTNSFILSLQKQLKSPRLEKEELDGKMVKVLSVKQYEAAKASLE
jgi:hypothetical protein